MGDSIETFGDCSAPAPTDEPPSNPSNGPSQSVPTEPTPAPTNNPAPSTTNPATDPTSIDNDEYEIIIKVEDANKLSADELDKILGDILKIDDEINSVEVTSVDDDSIKIYLTAGNELE